VKEAADTRILFVDDEEAILDVAREFFQIKGYRVFTAGNGLEALEILGRERIDCCFSDINMPQMDGLELADHIRQRDNSIPVIIMTGYPSLDNTIRTLKNGVVDFLIKPVNLNQMEICVRRVLRERRLFVENILLKQEVESKARLEKLNRELTFKVTELNTLNRIVTGFADIGDSAGVFNQVVNLGAEVSQADETRFFVINEAQGRPFAVAERAASASQGAAGAAGEGQTPLPRLIMEIAADGVPLLVAENNGTRGIPPELHSLMGVPLTIRDKVFGILMAASRNGGRRFNERDLYYLSCITQHAAHAIENLALYENIYENLFATLYAFVTALEARDAYTRQHSKRVTDLSVLMAREMGRDPEELEIINVAGLLHDIGKIGIRDDILLKPGRLSAAEFEKIKEHPQIGASMIESLGLWDREKQIIKSHHERYDGSGYPEGLSRGQIPLLARILSVADAYDAMASDRAYRRRMEEEQVVAIIAQGAGSQFDPQIVAVFLELHGNGRVAQVLDL
jgi:putative nucleotidyltransferase with HDIG domain